MSSSESDTHQPVPGAGPSDVSRPTPPTGTISLVFTDIQGSTALWERLRDDFAPILEAHNTIMRRTLAAHQGYEVKTVGDAFMIAFPSAALALSFCIDAQVALHAHPWPSSSGELLVRMGIHTGSMICELDPSTGRADYFGPTVNAAARIESAAHGGQILLGSATRQLLASDPRVKALLDLGEHRLKGIECPERLYQVAHPSLPARKFAALATLTSIPTNLPTHLSTFVGRDRETQSLVEILTEPRARVVTITGPGGTGKSRLSVRVGATVLDRFPGGCWFVDLVDCHGVEDVSAAVAAALDVPLSTVVGSTSERPEKVIAGVLASRKPLLLILDNFEHVARLAPQTVGLWQSQAPQLRTLVTSQAVLGLQGEREFRLEPLATPPRPGELGWTALKRAGLARSLMRFDAVHLFVERALGADARFVLTDQNGADVAEICVELDGLPLAIELAAARIRVLSPAQLRQRLTDKFQLLARSRTDAPQRHQTLASAVEWSVDMLPEDERSCFLQACVFRGGFSIEAAEAVIDLSAHGNAPFALDVIQSLCEKSLLHSHETPFGVQYHTFTIPREFGRRRWTDAAALQLRHANHYLEFAEHWARRVDGPESAEAIERLSLERENLLDATDHFLRLGSITDAARVVLAADASLAQRASTSQRCALFDRVLQKAGGAGTVPEETRARLITGLSRARRAAGDWEAAIKLADQAVTAAETSAEPGALVFALTNQADIYRPRGQTTQSLAIALRAEALARQHGWRPALARILNSRGLVLQAVGRGDEALAVFTEAEAINRELGRRTGIVACLNNRGRLLRDKADFNNALACFDEARDSCRDAGDLPVLAQSLGNRASALVLIDRADEALRDLTEAERIFSELGDQTNAVRTISLCAEVHERRGNLVEAIAGFREAVAVFRAQGQRRSLALTLGKLGRVLALQTDKAPAVAALRECVALLGEVGAGQSREALEYLGTLAVLAHEAVDPGARAHAEQTLALAATLGLNDLPAETPLGGLLARVRGLVA